MVKKQKTGKERLDKYYHLAKEQGFRARSAFKLIQLNKKFDFLNSARVCIDLCAAPGGWLQVAQKNMPVSSLIIGVDLVPIKPISNVITLVEDITTDKCRASLRKELKTWQADVVLHDGAPNMGQTWIGDAFTQSQLVLSSLKLASEFLRPGGTFVSKVFRSRDYNSLLWVFNQLFRKVSATKPSSSRNVSAEIFVVAQDFIAPARIDPRLFDIKHVFEEVDAPQPTDENSLLLGKQTKARAEGYADGKTLLFDTVSVDDFVTCKEPAEILARINQIKVTPEDEQRYGKFLDTDVRASMEDVRVLGKKELKGLLKFRNKAKKEVIEKEEKSARAQEEDGSGASDHDDEESELDVEDQLDNALRSAKEKEEQRLKKAAKKQREVKMKQKARLGGFTHDEIGAEFDEDYFKQDGLFSLKTLNAATANDDDSEDSDSSADSHPGDEDIDAALEKDLDRIYNEYTARKNKKKQALMEQERTQVEVSLPKGKLTEEDQWFDSELFKGVAAPASTKVAQQAAKRPRDDSDSDGSDDDDDESVSDSDSDSDSDSASDGENYRASYQESKAKAKETKEGFEEVPRELEDPEVKATVIAYAQKMLRKKQRMEMIDAAYNRYAFDDDLSTFPSWFADQEREAMRPIAPVTKAEILEAKRQLIELNARPIKKIAEAKARKQGRLAKKVEKIATKANSVLENEEVSSKEKARMLDNLYKQSAKASIEKRAKKMERMDGKLKKELRGEKRAAKAVKKGKGKPKAKRSKTRHRSRH
jgi:AdoMet-dependent rRNA methyltransferase SPB1